MFMWGAVKKVKEVQAVRHIVQYVSILFICYIISVVVSEALWTKNVGLLHTTFELLCIFIALASFLIVWLTYDSTTRSNRIIGFGFLTVGIYDIAHTYFHPSINLYPAGFFDLSTRFWLAGRTAEAFLLLISTTMLIKLRLNKWFALLITFAISIGTSWALFSSRGFIPLLQTNAGVTPPKIFGEYVIIALFIVALIKLGKKNGKRDLITYKHISMAIMIAIPAELCFTLFTTITSFFNTFGHILKIVYYYYLFKGIFASAVTYPIEVNNITKEKLKQSGNELMDILNGLPLGILTYDNSGRVSYANKNAAKLLECTQDALIGLTVQQLVDIVAPGKVSLSCQLQESPNHTVNVTKEYMTYKGNPVVFNVNMFKYKNGIIASFSDAAKEQQLNELQIQTRTILNSVSNQVLLTDIDFNIIMLNKAFEECVEMQYEEVMGANIKNINQILQFTVNSGIYDINSRAILSENAREGSFITPKGNKKFVLFQSSPVLNLDNKVIGYICVSSDITQYKKAQEKIQHQEKLAIIGQMGAGIVHETKNHLASIKGYCQLLSFKVSDPHLKKHIERIENISADLNRVIVDFLTLAKPTETMMDICSLNEIIESMRYMLESPSFMKGVTIEISLAEDDEDIKADESQIKQIILNMAKNAIEAMSDVKNAHLRITTRCYNQKMQLVISDNGKGITKENLKKIGSPFFTTKETGTGLGLNVCYRMIREHGGHIDVQSELGKGTTFTVSFPCVEDYDLEYSDIEFKIS